MSKKLTKILTICGMVIVFVAAIVASAVCLTTAVSFTVTLDTILQRAEGAFVPDDAKVVLTVDGKEIEGNSIKVQKDKVITIAYKAKDYNFSGWVNGAYTDGAELNKEVCKIKVNEDKKASFVFSAAAYQAVTLTQDAGEGVVVNIVGNTAEAEKNVYPVEDTPGKYYVKKGSEITLSYTTTDYDLVGWFNGTTKLPEDGLGNALITINGDTDIAAKFDRKQAYVITLESTIKNPSVGNIKLYINGQEVAGNKLSVNIVRNEAGDPVIPKVKVKTSAVGYDFAGWKKGGEVVSTDTEYELDLTGDMTLVADYSIKTYNVTYVEGDAQTTETLNYGQSFKVSAANKVDNGSWKVWTGWAYQGSEVKVAGVDVDVKDVELTAVYKNQKDYTYVITVGNGSITYNSATGISSITTPTRANSTFKGIVYGEVKCAVDATNKTVENTEELNSKLAELIKDAETKTININVEPEWNLVSEEERIYTFMVEDVEFKLENGEIVGEAPSRENYTLNGIKFEGDDNAYSVEGTKTGDELKAICANLEANKTAKFDWSLKKEIKLTVDGGEVTYNTETGAFTNLPKDKQYYRIGSLTIGKEKFEINSNGVAVERVKFNKFLAEKDVNTLVLKAQWITKTIITIKYPQSGMLKLGYDEETLVQDITLANVKLKDLLKLNDSLTVGDYTITSITVQYVNSVGNVESTKTFSGNNIKTGSLEDVFKAIDADGSLDGAIAFRILCGVTEN